MVSLSVTLEPMDGFTVINRHTSDDLPPHIKGTAFWITHETWPSRYYYTEPNQQPAPVELINNTWHLLHWSSTICQFGTHELYCITPLQNSFGLGYWHQSEPSHPLYQEPTSNTTPTTPTNMSTYHAPPPEISDSDHEMERVPSPISESKKPWGLAMHVPIKVDNTLKPTIQGPTIGTITAAFDIVPSLQGSLPLDPPSEPPTMSVNITTTSPALNVPNRGMQGVPPAIFDGMQSRADEFWSQFCCYKLVNWAHKSMTKTLWQGTHGTHIYIQGPMIND